MDEEIELTSSEREALRSAFQEPLPLALEDRVVATLRRQGLLRNRYRRMARWTAGMAAALALFASGAFLERVRAAPPPGEQFMLLLYEDATFQHAPASDPGAHAREYGSWARSLSGHLVGGEELSSAGKLLAGNAISDQLPSAGAGVVAGYFLIAARDMDEAVRIARDCPHLRHGGRISLRPLVSGRR